MAMSKTASVPFSDRDRSVLKEAALILELSVEDMLAACQILKHRSLVSLSTAQEPPDDSSQTINGQNLPVPKRPRESGDCRVSKDGNNVPSFNSFGYSSSFDDDILRDANVDEEILRQLDPPATQNGHAVSSTSEIMGSFADPELLHTTSTLANPFIANGPRTFEVLSASHADPADMSREALDDYTSASWTSVPHKVVQSDSNHGTLPILPNSQQNLYPNIHPECRKLPETSHPSLDLDLDTQYRESVPTSSGLSQFSALQAPNALGHPVVQFDNVERPIPNAYLLPSNDGGISSLSGQSFNGYHDGDLLNLSLFHDRFQGITDVSIEPNSAAASRGSELFIPPESQQLNINMERSVQKARRRRRGREGLLQNTQRQRRQPFRDPETRRRTGRTRELKACVRCRMLKIRVSKHRLNMARSLTKWNFQCELDDNHESGICLTCQTTTVSLVPCLRVQVVDSKLFAKGDNPRSSWSQRWTAWKIDEITMWKSAEVKTIMITQDVGGTSYSLRVREFIPLQGDALGRTWSTNGGQVHHLCANYAVENMDGTGPELARFVTNSIYASIEHYIAREDGLLWHTYTMALRHARQAKVTKPILPYHPSGLLIDWSFSRYRNNALSYSTPFNYGQQSATDPDLIESAGSKRWA
jgi:hypothetical protein